jgi:hypothetical protein
LGLPRAVHNVTTLSMSDRLGLASLGSGPLVCVWRRVHTQIRARRALAAARTSDAAAARWLRAGGGGDPNGCERQKSCTASSLDDDDTGREWTGQVAGLGTAVSASAAAHVGCKGGLDLWAAGEGAVVSGV